MIQDTIFEKSESDAWFLRNEKAIINRHANNDIIYRMICGNINKEKITSILDLGCSNGFRLNFFKSLPNIKKLVGVDLSEKAIEDGIARYGLELYIDSISDFEYNYKFDLVIVNFVFHWVSREFITKAIYNTDRYVSGGGALVIGDFYSPTPCKRFYHHLPDEKVYTYKTDYPAIFKSFGTYKKLSNLYYDTDNVNNTDRETIDKGNLCLCELLQKTLDENYVEVN